MSTIFRDISRIDAMPSHIETSGRAFGLGLGKTTFRSGLFSQDCSRQNMQFGSSNNVDDVPDQRQRISNVLTSSSGMRSFALQSRNLTTHSSVLQERGIRMNQDFKVNNNTSVNSNPFWPAVRNTTLTTGLQMQDTVRCNDEMIDEGGFRRPLTVSRVIRGRNSTLSSRLFHNQNTERHYKDLSNINGFNVSHISRREVDTLSESRLALNTRSNWMDNQSISGSVMSMVSMKAQFMNVLENLHHSILNIGPHVNAEAVRMEFDKAKQGLENISEMSFAPSVKQANAASVISQSSKYICPPIGESTITKNVLDGESLNLKSGKELLKTLISSKDNYKSKFNLTTHAEEGEGNDVLISSSQCKSSDNEENSSLVFKKPRPYNNRRKNTRIMKIKAPSTGRSLPGKDTKKEMSLHQWFPIAVGFDLAFCGVDENGSTVKTEPVKKRLNNRKVELVTGVDCNLIGNPSPMVSVLPQKIAAMLKNGLTDRWRVLQKELLNCQTAEEETKRRKSKSPKSKSPKSKSPKLKSPKMVSPKSKVTTEKKTEKLAAEKAKKRKSKSPKVISTPKKKGKVTELHTRSGRAVKQPSMFWLTTGSNEVTSSLDQEIETTVQDVKSKIKSRKSTGKSPVRKSKEVACKSPVKKSRKAKEESPRRKASTSSSRKYKKQTEENSFTKSKEKTSKAKSPKQNKKNETKEEVKVHSSTENTRRQNKSQQSRGKRKREVPADADSVQSKKSKLEKKTEIEVESTVKSSEEKNPKNMKRGLTLSSRSPKPKGPTNRKKETVKKKNVKNVSETQKEVTVLTEFEKNFDLKLDDIEIPEIVNVSGNPQLSRSQLRLVSMETPPLKYFNSNLRLMRSTTPVQSPDWYISQRTESEVKQFQRRREEAFKKRIKMNVQKTRTIITEKSKNVQNKDVKRVMEWVAEKTVKSPQWNSKVLQYVLPSRKRMEEEADDDDEEDFETEFL